MQEERAQLDGHQIVVPLAPAVQPALLRVEEECQDEVATEDSMMVDGDSEHKVEIGNVKGSEQVAVRGKGRGRGRGRGRGKTESDRVVGQEMKGRGRGKKNVDGESEGAARGEEGVRGKLKGRGRGRVVTVVTSGTPVQEADGQLSEDAGELKECFVCVDVEYLSCVLEVFLV